MENTEKPQPRRAVVAAAAGFAAVAAYAIVGALQILVWNPLAAVPGATLGQIRAEMARADESLTANWVLAWGGIGIVLATVVLLVTIVRMNSRVEPVVAAYLVLLIFAAPGHFFAGFGPGMSLADTFLVSGADHAPWGMLLYVVSAASLLALIVLIIRAGRAATARAARHG
ncbi:hypothetical protein E3O45_11715 [Cryobacterium sp. TMS1-20-1]|uniref:hypothetical protein n=1 Tax=Cryobacterium sp. TMS1-20-1 TaxID=1259223 RepID=UPI001069D0A8|nr:hypothetical protein [Cryobacterium sp. TMS1-20-1]TFC73558.1 hypothetical protein E3O45_11715 [Cryobacterium sp. TMS1-20-1]